MSGDRQAASLYPVKSWLERNDALTKFISSVSAYVAQDMGSEQARAENAAKMYLAFCMGLQDAGLLAVQHAPVLWVDIGETAFKISLKHDGSTASIVSLDTNTLSSPVTSFFNAAHFLDATSRGARASNLVAAEARPTAKVSESRVLSFLEAIRAQLVTTPGLQLAQDTTTPSSALLPACCPPAQPQDLAGLESIAFSLLQLDRIDTQAERLACKINDSYFALGRAYGRTIGAADNGPQGWKVPHTSQTEIMYKLSDFHGLTYLATSKGRLAWSKRLQRAHKFCLLVDIFGVEILEATPAVSVSKLDKVSLGSLERDESGGIGCEIATSIKSLMKV